MFYEQPPFTIICNNHTVTVAVMNELWRTLLFLSAVVYVWTHVSVQGRPDLLLEYAENRWERSSQAAQNKCDTVRQAWKRRAGMQSSLNGMPNIGFNNYTGLWLRSCLWPAWIGTMTFSCSPDKLNPVQSSNVEHHIDVQAGSWLNIQIEDKLSQFSDVV